MDDFMRVLKEEFKIFIAAVVVFGVIIGVCATLGWQLWR